MAVTLVCALTVGSSAWAQNLPVPKSPVTLSIVDVAGDLALTQAAIETYQAKNPNLVAKVNFTKAPAPEHSMHESSSLRKAQVLSQPLAGSRGSLSPRRYGNPMRKVKPGPELAGRA